MRQVILLVVLAVGLAACAGPPSAASIRGACDAFDPPTEQVRGQRRQDQRWIDKNVEAGVSACGWSRPTSANGAGT